MRMQFRRWMTWIQIRLPWWSKVGRKVEQGTDNEHKFKEGAPNRSDECIVTLDKGGKEDASQTDK